MASQTEWLAHISQVIPEPEATRYAAEFSRNYLPIDVASSSTGGSPVPVPVPAGVAKAFSNMGHGLSASNASNHHILADITEEHLKEMGVMIGHRPIIRNLFAEIRRSAAAIVARHNSALTAKQLAVAGGGGAFSNANSPKSGDNVSEDHPHAIVAVAQAIGVISALHTEVKKDYDPAKDRRNYFDRPRTERASLNVESKLKWVGLYGDRTSADALMTEARSLQSDFGFPLPFIERAFKDDGPMPFFLQDDNHAVFLMRIPELDAESGTTIKTITNRVVLLFRDGTATEPPLLVSYHRNPNTAFHNLHSRWTNTLQLNTTDVSATAKEFFKQLLTMYRESITSMEVRSEIAECDPKPEVAIEKLSLIQKQAAVYARCLKCFQDVMLTTKGFANFEDFADEMAEVASGLDAKAMELSENANTTINLKMALDGYRASVNMKYFTYLSILCQPVAVATGWYGMNFANMPELLYVNTYFIFCGCVLFVVLTIAAFLFYIEKYGGSAIKEDNKKKAE